MRLKNWLILGLWLTIAAIVFNSCSKDDGYSLDKAWYSIATVHPLSSNSFWLSLDDGTTLWPVASNIPWYQPNEKKRAFAVYTLLSDKYYGYNHAIKVLDLKSILTKSISENLGSTNNSIYGTDSVKISDMWIGDGFLNIVFEFNYGGNVVHFINLVERNDMNTPFFFEFRHNAYDDEVRYRRKGIVCFDLSTIDTNGEEVVLSILVNTFEGEKIYSIKYSSGSPDAGSHNYSMEDFVETK